MRDGVDALSSESFSIMPTTHHSSVSGTGGRVRRYASLTRMIGRPSMPYQTDQSARLAEGNRADMGRLTRFLINHGLSAFEPVRTCSNLPLHHRYNSATCKTTAAILPRRLWSFFKPSITWVALVQPNSSKSSKMFAAFDHVEYWS